MKLTTIATWFLRIALAAGFLSAVADRFGMWGPPGGTNVAWGNMENFISYVGVLNSFLPEALYPLLAWGVTIAEIIVGIGLLIGRKLKWFAYASFILLFIFAMAMSFTTGIKTALDASVYTGAAGALMLAVMVRNKKRQDR